MTTMMDLLRAAERRMEMTERGLIEKVTTIGHGKMETRITARLLTMGVQEDWLMWGVRLTQEANGTWYVPDGMIVLPSNPIPGEDAQIYAGTPDLAIEIFSPGEANRERDLEEKRVAYARRGIPNYWIADPATNTVLWLRLRSPEQVYNEEWTRPLSEVELPWEARR